MQFGGRRENDGGRPRRNRRNEDDVAPNRREPRQFETRDPRDVRTPKISPQVKAFADIAKRAFDAEECAQIADLLVKRGGGRGPAPSNQGALNFQGGGRPERAPRGPRNDERDVRRGGDDRRDGGRRDGGRGEGRGGRGGARGGRAADGPRSDRGGRGGRAAGADQAEGGARRRNRRRPQE